MCQMKNIPARLVVGYVAKEYNSLGGFYLIRDKHAHAWAEVFIPGMDWVTFDPTPSSERQVSRFQLYRMGLRIYTDYLQFRWAEGVLSFDFEYPAAVV